MKSFSMFKMRLFGIIALVMAIGFTFTACGGGATTKKSPTGLARYVGEWCSDSAGTKVAFKFSLDPSGKALISESATGAKMPGTITLNGDIMTQAVAGFNLGSATVIVNGNELTVSNWNDFLVNKGTYYKKK